MRSNSYFERRDFLSKMWYGGVIFASKESAWLSQTSNMALLSGRNMVEQIIFMRTLNEGTNPVTRRVHVLTGQKHRAPMSVEHQESGTRRAELD